jgi:RNase P/RNase MRP subunit p30
MDISLYKEKNCLYLKEINSKKELDNFNEGTDGFLMDSDEKEVRKITESLKNKKLKKLIFVKAKDDLFNRRMIETCHINALVSLELNKERDTLKQRSSGFNHVIAKEASKKGVSIIIDFSALEKLEKKEKAKAIAKIIQNINICKKNNCNIKIASFARNKNELKNEIQLKAFLFSLGASSQQVSKACGFNY